MWPPQASQTDFLEILKQMRNSHKFALFLVFSSKSFVFGRCARKVSEILFQIVFLAYLGHLVASEGSWGGLGGVCSILLDSCGLISTSRFTSSSILLRGPPSIPLDSPRFSSALGSPFWGHGRLAEPLKQFSEEILKPKEIFRCLSCFFSFRFLLLLQRFLEFPCICLICWCWHCFACEDMPVTWTKVFYVDSWQQLT